MIIDLTVKLCDKTPPYPGSPEMRLTEKFAFERDGFTSRYLCSDMHTGTHIDLPMHFGINNLTANTFPLEGFMGEGVLLSCNDSVINLPLPDINGKCLLINTGHGKNFGNEDYFKNHPVISEEFALKIIAAKPKLIGIDTPSPDYFPFNCHKLLLKAGIPIVENLCNLDSLPQGKSFRFFAIPLKIEAEASLIRAFAEVL